MYKLFRRRPLEYLATGCDLLIIPTSPSRADMDVMVDTVTALKKIGSERYRVLFTKVRPKPNRDAEKARAILKQHGIPVFEHGISFLIAFERAVDFGCLIYDVKEPLAYRGWEDYRSVMEEAI